MSEYAKRENLKSLALSFRLDHPTAGNDEQLVQAVDAAPADVWQSTETVKPTKADGPIVGRDVLGYYYLATHLVGGDDRMLPDAWAPLSAFQALVAESPQ